MKILFDLTHINPNSSSGIVIYAHRLLLGIQEVNAANQIVLLATNHNRFHIEKTYPNFEIAVIQTNNNFLLTKIHFFKGYFFCRSINKLVRNHNISLFFTPYLRIGGFQTSKVPQIGVLHDAQFYILSKNEKFKGAIFRFLMLKFYKNFDQIITISNYSKSSIIKEMPNLRVPISVISNSVVVPDAPSEAIFKNYKPYILFVNTLMPYKNLKTLVLAFIELKDIIEHKLIIKAKKHPYWTTVIEPLLIQHDIQNRVFLLEDRFTDLQMASLNAEADLFVSPSLMEGFGFTPIEAAMQMTPVITSMESALYETTLGLLNYYEPADDHLKLAGKMNDILKNKPSNDRLLEIKSYFHKTYSPSTQAIQFMELFNQYSVKNKEQTL